MQCPKCGARGRCIDTRPKGSMRVRRYRCPDCKITYGTLEFITDNRKTEGVKKLLRVLDARDPDRKTVLANMLNQFIRQEDASGQARTNKECGG